MADFILDPVDPEQALTPDGRLAARVYFINGPIPAAGAPVTRDQLDRDRTFVGWMEPLTFGDDGSSAFELAPRDEA